MCKPDYIQVPTIQIRAIGYTLKTKGTVMTWKFLKPTK